MVRKSEPAHLEPRPRSSWLTEVKQRYPEIDPSAVQPVLAVLNLGRKIRETIVPHIERIGLTEARFTTVMMLLRFEWEARAATPSELAVQAGVGRAAMTQLLDGLESSGWIKRRSQSGDRRKVTITLTDEGRGRLDEFLPQHYRRIEKALASVSAPDRKRLLEVLAEIEAGLREV